MMFNAMSVILSYYYLQNLLQLKKISNSKPAAEPDELSEMVEQVSMTNENDGGKNAEELAAGTTKEIEVLDNGVVENGKEESRAAANQGKKRKFPSREEKGKKTTFPSRQEKGKKRKFPSREEISKARSKPSPCLIKPLCSIKQLHLYIH